MNGLLHETNIGESTFIVDISLENINIEQKEIEALLGYDLEKTPSHFVDLINVALNDLPKRLSIKTGYKILPTIYNSKQINGLLIGDKYFSLDKIVTGIFKNSEEAAIFCVTIGEGMEQHSKALNMNNDLVNAFVYDIVASVTVEACADTLHNHIINKMKLKNKKTTNRYSPGYCNWDIREQHILFSLLPENFCGIILTDSALMTPIKSISGIIGIGENVKYSQYHCNECKIKDCTYRTIKKMSK